MKKIILALTFTGSVFATNTLIFDSYFSPYVGADDLILTHDIVEKSKLGHLADKYLAQKSRWAQLGRGAELFFFWDPANYVTSITQHEVFGHGYRVRSLADAGARVINYEIGIPYPYGHGGGLTRYSWDLSKITSFDTLAISTGGVEATAICANRIKFQWLQKGQVNPRQSSLYLFSEHDITNYILRTTKKSGDDIADYIYLLNRTYAHSDLSAKTLRKSAFINFLDPFTYYSMFSWYKYVSRGTQGPLPMIPIGSYKYLPGARMGLTPFGPEYYLENFLVKGDKPIYFYLRGGNFAGMKSAGFGIEYPQLWQIGSMFIGVRGDLWQQPKIDSKDLRFACSELKHTKSFNLDIQDSRLGMSFSVIAQQKLWSEGALFVQFGAKSKGFVPGEGLEASPILRVGITLW